MTDALLEVRDLHVVFDSDRATRAAVDGVSFDVPRGHTVALLGGSGAGKTATALGILCLVEPPAAATATGIVFDGVDLGRLSEAERTRVRGARIALVPQEPGTALDPEHSIGTQVVDVIRSHRDVSGREGRRQAVEILRAVGFPAPAARLGALPRELSAGMCQRVLIAMAVVNQPDLLILDEPMSHIDPLSRTALVGYLEQQQASEGTSMLLITREASLAREMADRVLVLYHGSIVESGPAEDVLESPLHPYTRALLGRSGEATGTRRLHLLEEHDDSSAGGCRYAGPCALSRAGLSGSERCFRQEPRLVALPGDREVRCHFAQEGPE